MIYGIFMIKLLKEDNIWPMKQTIVDKLIQEPILMMDWKDLCLHVSASQSALITSSDINSSKLSILFIVYNFYIFQSSLKIETITCNKLSHCLFDFDCPDFSQYENEKYDHQVFKFHSLFSNQNEPKMLSLLDLSFFRDQMKISFDANKLDKIKYQN